MDHSLQIPPQDLWSLGSTFPNSPNTLKQIQLKLCMDFALEYSLIWHKNLSLKH